MIADMYEVAKAQDKREYKNLEMKTHFFESEIHVSVFPAIISRRLRAAFTKGL